MLKFLKRTEINLGIVIISSLILFLPGFFTYFHQDDFIHLSYSQNLNQVIRSFNIFQKGEFPFYRPLPTQLYFFINKTLFGLNPFGYHLVNFLIFSINILLIFRLAKLITQNKTVSLVTIIFFAVNSTHFAPLYSPAYVHELFYVLFGVLTVDNFLRKKYVFSILFFILALASKETAVVLPAIIFLTYWFINKKSKLAETFKILLPYIAVLGIYLFAHFFYYGIASGASYTLIVGKPTLNILAWYFLWAVSTPNILIDFVGPGLKLNPVFLQISQIHGIIYFLFFPILVVIGLILIGRLFIQKKNIYERKIILMGFAWFVIGMLPLIVFPLHKLATEQAFSLVGLSISLAVLLNSFINIPSPRRSPASWRVTIRGGLNLVLPILFIFLYLTIAVNSIFLARKTHWIVRSAQQAKNTIEYIEKNYPNLSDDASIYFLNGEVKISPYGSSRQLYQALGNGYGLRLVLNKPNLRLYFEDLGQIPKIDDDNDIIQIDSSLLLSY